MTPWLEVVPGAIIKGKDGYRWEVRSVEAGTVPGKLDVTMYREGRGEVTGHPTIGSLADVVSSPPLPDMAQAVKLLKDVLGAEVLSCGWCSGDSTAECICDFNCGRKGCVNF